MVLTVTLNPAIDKLLILNNFEVHKLHRLEKDEMSLVGPGGKGVNVALNLVFLGGEVIASGFAGGHAGHLLCDGLRQKGITTNFVFSSGLTRTNISILDKAHGTLSEINDFGQHIPPDDQKFLLDNYEKLLARVEYVVLAGSLPEGINVDYYSELIRLARERKKKVYFHAMPDYINELSETAPHIFHPDMRSFHELLGRPCDGIEQFIELGKELLVRNRETEYVFFTHRIENAVVISRNKEYILRPVDLKIVNMLGYNDAFIAGFIHGQVKGWNMVDSLRFASASGLSNVENIHKELHSVEVIQRNLERIEIEEKK
jgi:1-phosphofructokinase family hexose kinase